LPRNLLVNGGIGNGAKTEILTDNWISDVSPVTVCTLVPLVDRHKVDALFQEDTRAWNIDKVRTIFTEDVAEKIL
jgi:hypothetical protein